MNDYDYLYKTLKAHVLSNEEIAQLLFVVLYILFF